MSKKRERVETSTKIDPKRRRRDTWTSVTFDPVKRGYLASRDPQAFAINVRTGIVYTITDIAEGKEVPFPTRVNIKNTQSNIDHIIKIAQFIADGHSAKALRVNTWTSGQPLLILCFGAKLEDNEWVHMQADAFVTRVNAGLTSVADFETILMRNSALMQEWKKFQIQAIQMFVRRHPTMHWYPCFEQE